MVRFRKEEKSMPRLGKKLKEELVFFISDKGRIRYCDKCRKCICSCKQSFRAEIVACPKFERKVKTE